MNYFKACHRDPAFIDRWKQATGSWDNKIVVDIGCGPGNVFASLGGSPSLLVGVDVSFGALKMAKSIGYTPLLHINCLQANVPFREMCEAGRKCGKGRATKSGRHPRVPPTECEN